MKLAILVVSRNRPEFVEDMVNQLRSTVTVPHEIYTVESGTELSQFSRLSTLWCADDESRGECHAVNLGLMEARLDEDYDYYWVLRSDVTFPCSGDIAAQMIDTMEKNPRMAVLAPDRGLRPGAMGEAPWHAVASTEYPGMMVRAEAIEVAGFLGAEFRWSVGAMDEFAFRLYSKDWFIAESREITCRIREDSPFENEEITRRASRFAYEFIGERFGESWESEFWRAAQGHLIETNDYRVHKELWAEYFDPKELQVTEAVQRGSSEGIEPWPLATDATFLLFAWPCYDRPEELDALLEAFGRPIQGRSDICLCLRHDLTIDGSQTLAISALEESFTRVLGPTAELEVLLVDDSMQLRDLVRLGKAVTGVIPLPSSSEEPRATHLRAMDAPVISSEEDLRALVPGLALAGEDAPRYSTEELDTVNWELVAEIKRLHPWLHPVHIGNLRVTPGTGTEVPPADIEAETTRRAAQLVHGVMRKIDLRGRSVLDLRSGCGFWSARYAELGVNRVTLVEPDARLRRQAELYWSKNRFLPTEQVRLLDGKLEAALTWDEISAAGPHDITLCADYSSDTGQLSDFLRRAAEVTRETLILSFPTAAEGGPAHQSEAPERSELFRLLEELGYTSQVLPAAAQGAAVTTHAPQGVATWITILARRTGVPIGAESDGSSVSERSARTTAALGRQ